jgi:uncharacterized protein
VIVIVYGYDGSGPGHWQRWLEDELRARGAHVAFPALPDPLAPDRDGWVAALEETIAAGAGEPLTFVCHSLGCWAVDHLLAAREARGELTTPTFNPWAALLVAPPSPFLVFEPVESFLPPPQRRAAWAPLAARTLVVGGDDDEYSSPGELESIAGDLGAGCRILRGAGHVNVASGFGRWPFALEWLAEVGAR